jgi:GTP-binding protein
MGGPDGGDGGKGGSVCIVADPRVISLSHLQKNRTFGASNGGQGMGLNRSGKNGEDLVIKVPIGTVVFDEEENILCDCVDETMHIICEGGRGGKGNEHFKSSTQQTPRFAQPGEEGISLEIRLALKLIADIGLVGLPNSGKSTLLKAITHADPKIGNYPFTTLSPNLGTLELSAARHIIVADIPGIIEGASKGHGLGLSFLKHIERVSLLMFVLDVTLTEVDHELEILRQELNDYNPILNERPYLIVFNKCDMIDPEFLSEWIASFEEKNMHPIPISALNHEGLDLLLDKMRELILQK